MEQYPPFPSITFCRDALCGSVHSAATVVKWRNPSVCNRHRRGRNLSRPAVAQSYEWARTRAPGSVKASPCEGSAEEVI